MKALKLVIFGMLLFCAVNAHAQVSVNVNIGPPQWGPVGYTDVRYYYLPDVEAYYDVPSSKFIYLNDGVWVHRSNLPGRYRSYDLYHGYKVVMTDYRGNSPYTYFHDHKIKYAKGYHGKPQKTYGEKPHKANLNYKNYSRNISHGEHQEKNNEKGHGNGKGKGNKK